MLTYFQYLIWMMVFVIIIEMIFPDSSYRKYIKLVLSCILIYTMLSPIIGFIKVDGQDYEGYVKKYQQLLIADQTDEGSYEMALKKQQDYLRNMYEQSITAYVEGQFEVKVQQVAVSWQEDALYEIALTVGEKTENTRIGTIHIGDKSDSISGDEAVLKNKIKTCLSDFYNVQVCNIHITVQKN